MSLQKFNNWFTFVLCLSLFGLATTPFGPVADRFLVLFRISAILAVSALLIWRSFKNGIPPSGYRYRDSSDALLHLIARWYYGEKR